MFGFCIAFKTEHLLWRLSIHNGVHKGRKKEAPGENMIILTDTVIAIVIILPSSFAFHTRHSDLNKI